MSQARCPPCSPVSWSYRKMNCHHACRKSGREKVSPGGCTLDEILSSGSTDSRRNAEAACLPRLVAHPRISRRRAGTIESAMDADDGERARVEVNRRAREEAGAARQPRAGSPEDIPVGQATTGDDDDVNAGGAAGNTAPWSKEPTRQCMNRHQERLRGVPRPEPEVRVIPPLEMSQRPNGAVKRRTS